MNNYLRKFFYFFIFFVLLTIDQVSKYLIRTRGGFYICNQNLAFSFSLPLILFWIIWFFIVFWLGWMLYKKYFLAETFYLILILAGALSNMLDRVYYGCVIDFIDLHFWPIFNLADTFIVVGVLILIFKLLKKHSYVE